MVVAAVVAACPEPADISAAHDDDAMAAATDPDVWQCGADPTSASLDGGSALQLSLFWRVVSARAMAATTAEDHGLGQSATEPAV